MLLLEVDPVFVGTSQKHTPKCVELSSFCCLSDVNSNTVENLTNKIHNLWRQKKLLDFQNHKDKCMACMVLLPYMNDKHVVWYM